MVLTFTHLVLYAALVAVGFSIIFVLYAIIRTAQHEKREVKRFTADVTQLVEKNKKRSLTAFITGANSGIGFSLAETLAGNGVRVLLGCRNLKRAQEARKKIIEKHSDAKVNIVIIDVADPKSVLTAVKALKSGGNIDGVSVPKLDHLDYLFLNAGVMPSTHDRWHVALHATVLCNLRYFMETGRAHPQGHHFVANPDDDAGVCGVPSVFATHVLGHILLAQECVDLLQPVTKRGKLEPRSAAWDAHGGGRIVWTGSRAACASFLDWTHLQPPTEADQPSAHTQMRTAGYTHGESYGEAKRAVDLVNPALEKALGVPCTVICPGAVETDLTPASMKLATAMMAAFRAFLPGFNLTTLRGAYVLLAASVCDITALRADRKYVSWAGDVVEATAGFETSTPEEQQRMLDLCNAWLTLWRAHAAAVNIASD